MFRKVDGESKMACPSENRPKSAFAAHIACPALGTSRPLGFSPGISMIHNRPCEKVQEAKAVFAQLVTPFSSAATKKAPQTCLRGSKLKAYERIVRKANRNKNKVNKGNSARGRRKNSLRPSLKMPHYQNIIDQTAIQQSFMEKNSKACVQKIYVTCKA